jgi:hypothetical protein
MISCNSKRQKVPAPGVECTLFPVLSYFMSGGYVLPASIARVCKAFVKQSRLVSERVSCCTAPARTLLPDPAQPCNRRIFGQEHAANEVVHVCSDHPTSFRSAHRCAPRQLVSVAEWQSLLSVLHALSLKNDDVKMTCAWSTTDLKCQCTTLISCVADTAPRMLCCTLSASHQPKFLRPTEQSSSVSQAVANSPREFRGGIR